MNACSFCQPFIGFSVLWVSVYSTLSSCHACAARVNWPDVMQVMAEKASAKDNAAGDAEEVAGNVMDNIARKVNAVRLRTLFELTGHARELCPKIPQLLARNRSVFRRCCRLSMPFANAIGHGSLHTSILFVCVVVLCTVGMRRLCLKRCHEDTGALSSHTAT